MYVNNPKNLTYLRSHNIETCKVSLKFTYSKSTYISSYNDMKRIYQTNPQATYKNMIVSGIRTYVFLEYLRERLELAQPKGARRAKQGKYILNYKK